MGVYKAKHHIVFCFVFFLKWKEIPIFIYCKSEPQSHWVVGNSISSSVSPPPYGLYQNIRGWHDVPQTSKAPAPRASLLRDHVSSPCLHPPPPDPVLHFWPMQFNP